MSRNWMCLKVLLDSVLAHEKRSIETVAIFYGLLIGVLLISMIPRS